MASTISAGTTSGTAIAVAGDTSGVLQLQTNGTTTAMTIDTSQNVGIGTSSPLVPLHVVTTGTSTAMGNNVIATFRSGAAGRAATIQLSDGTNSNYVSSLSGALGFGTGSTERMRIDSSGNLLIGTTSQLTGHLISASTVSGQLWGFGPYSGIGNNFYVSYNGNTGVYLVGGGTSWSSNSDERLKADLLPIEDASNKVCSLRAVTGRYKTDAKGVSRSFLIAQDVQKVLPEAVNVQVDEQGTLGVAYTDVIPLLVAAIKELNAKVDAQAVRIAELEGAK
jgi:hypothetical protein